MIPNRILFVTGSQSLSGGTERACANLANFLFREGKYEIFILSATNGQHSFFEIDSDIRMNEIYPTRRSLQINGISFILRLRSFFKKNKPEIIIIVESFLSAFVIPAAVGLPARLINWEHFDTTITLGAPVRRLARRLAARFCSHIVVLTENDRKSWLKKYSIKADKISCIYNINPMHEKLGSYVDNTGEHSEIKTVLTVGRLVTEKGYDLLLQAWNRIDKDIRRGWKLRIVGEGELRTTLLALAENLGISDEVEFPGRTQDVESEYRSAAIFVLTSRFEGLTLALIEAITFGLPIVTFNCSKGFTEIIENGKSGILVERLNVDKFAVELASLMISPEKRLALSQAAQPILERFSPQTVTRAWKRLLPHSQSDDIKRYCCK